MAKNRTVTRQLLDNTHSAAVASWAGAGASAAGAMQQARTARAAEELLELQRVEAEQTRHHQFAMWRQTPDGRAYLEWKNKAVNLARILRDRDAEWLEAWARAITRGRASVPAAETNRYVKYPALLKQSGLQAGAVIAFVLAALFGLNALFGVVAVNMSQYARTDSRISTGLVMLVLFSAIAVGCLIARSARLRAARADLTVAQQVEARAAHFGFDPLAFRPGQVPYPWYSSDWANGYADLLMDVALNGHHRLPAQGDLPGLAMPDVWQPNEGIPAEVNEVLAKYQPRN